RRAWSKSAGRASPRAAAVLASDAGRPTTRETRASASAPGLGTPASTSTASTALTRAARVPWAGAMGLLVRAREPRRLVGVDRRPDDRAEVAVEHLVQVVGLEAGAVVGDAVLGEV